ncbi:modification methylase [Leptotrichia trevisanii]|jgi:modification methylase hindIII|uniref:Methyltransferase n=1 Tax=Leptotrichia trevisanii TaxID=109328 RepID=A0A510KK52_9FUSO|nr:site-specific DNA-methyltransferase [Leptotrichia trevisanii]BBM52068.1 modification methylase [Leptotrichia trevisanii]
MFNKIVQGDSIIELNNIDSASIHAIISDIPYGIGIDDWDVLHNNTNSAYGGATSNQLKLGNHFKRRGKPLNGWSEADKKIPLEYQEWCRKWTSNWYRVLKPGASCFIFAGRRYAHRCIVAMEEAGFTFKDMLSWEKMRAPQRAQRVSAVFERRKDFENAKKWDGWRLANLKPLFEPILWFQKPYTLGGTITDNILKYEVGAWNERAFKENKLFADSIDISNILKVEYNKNDTGLHKAQKPLKLIEILIKLVTLEGQVVLDPFVGSGTVCAAAKKLNRQFLGIEINPEYVKIANERINKILGK